MATITGSSFDDYLDGTEQSDTIGGGDGYDVVWGNSGNDSINGGRDGDTLYGGLGNDVINGGSTGNDYLSGDEGNDTLIGGTGTDDLYGGAGDDLYKFNLGDGQDYISDINYYGGVKNDILQFGAGISLDNLIFKRGYNNALVVSIKDTKDQLIIDGYFGLQSGYNSDGFVSIKLFDGTLIAADTIWQQVNQPTTGHDVLYGTQKSEAIGGGDGNDTIYGQAGNDSINGGRDHDQLYGGLGNDLLNGGRTGSDDLYGDEGADTLIGGTENDHLYGGSGADTYQFNLGDGQDYIRENNYDDSDKKDILQFGAGISLDNLIFRRTYEGLLISIKDTQDQVMVSGYFSDDRGGSNVGFLNLKLSDGTVIDPNLISQKVIQPTAGNDYLFGTQKSENIGGGDGFDTIYGYAGNDSINGGRDTDELYGGLGADVLNGGRTGDDYLYGGEGSDILIGGTGNDSLFGGQGSDIYQYNVGDGQDYINDSHYYDDAEKNVLKFGAGISLDDLIFKRSYSNGLVVFVKDLNNYVSVMDYFGGLEGAYYDGFVDIQLADGTVIDADTVWQKINQPTAGDDTIYGLNTSEMLEGGAGNDIIYGRAGDDVLNGGLGSDSLYGDEGDDTLVGGVGRDSLSGGYGEDTYQFNLGDGQDFIYESNSPSDLKNDVLKFGTGISLDNLVFKRNYERDLLISIKDTQDYVSISGYFGGQIGDYYDGFVNVQLADGTIISADTVLQKVNQPTTGDDFIYGTDKSESIGSGDGDDTIYGRAGNDSLDGGRGNDTVYGDQGNDVLKGRQGYDSLFGGAGSDTYMIMRGTNRDYIEEPGWTGGQPNDVDTISFASDISYDQLWFRQGDYGFYDLTIRIIGSEDMIVVSNFFANSAYEVEKFTAGGKTLSKADLSSLIDAMSQFNVPTTSTMSADVKSQLADTLSAVWV